MLLTYVLLTNLLKAGHYIRVNIYEDVTLRFTI